MCIIIIQVGDFPQDVAKVYGALDVSNLLYSGHLSLQPSINIFIYLSDYVYCHPLIYVFVLLITYYHTVHRGTAQN